MSALYSHRVLSLVITQPKTPFLKMNVRFGFEDVWQGYQYAGRGYY